MGIEYKRTFNKRLDIATVSELEKEVRCIPGLLLLGKDEAGDLLFRLESLEAREKWPQDVTVSLSVDGCYVLFDSWGSAIEEKVLGSLSHLLDSADTGGSFEEL